MVGNGTEVIGQVAQEIDALKPDQVMDELAPFIEGGYLESMVAAEGVGRTLTVMGSVGDAIGRAPNPEDRTTLARGAADRLADILLDQDFTPEPFEDSAEALVERAGAYAELIEDPGDKSAAMSKVAEGTMAFILSYSDADEVFQAATRASSFVEKAVEAAEGIEDAPSRQAQAFAKAAGARTEIDFQLLRSGNPVEGDEAVRIYERAIDATGAIEDAEDRYHHRDNIVRSIVSSTAKIHLVSGNSEAYQSLFDLSLAKIDEELAGYETGGEEAGLSPWEKAINCIRLGGKLSGAIEEDFFQGGALDEARQALVSRMVNVYGAALKYRREANATFEEYDHNDRINFTDSALDAAEKLLDSDFDTAKELMGLGFDLSLAHKDPEHASEYSKRAIDKIRGYAEQQTSVRRAFEIFSMLYQKQRGTQAPGELPSHDDELTYTVFRNLWHLAGAPPEDVALEEIDRDFIEFTLRHAVADAVEPVYPRNSIDHIRKLGEYVADPELKRTILSQYEGLRARDEAAKRPATRIARIAFDRWQPNG